MLRLEIIESPSESAEGIDSFVVGPAGATVGRTDSCDWVLTDPNNQISRVHFRIFFEFGDYFIEDKSTNGSFINDALEPIGRNLTAPISAGDEIRLGEFRLRVSAHTSADADSNDLGSAPGLLSDLAAKSASEDAPLPEPEPAPAVSAGSGAFDEIEPAPISDNLLGGGTPGYASRRPAPPSLLDAGAGEAAPLKVPVSSRHDPTPILSPLDSEPVAQEPMAEPSFTPDLSAGNIAPGSLGGNDKQIPEDWLSDLDSDQPELPVEPNPAKEPLQAPVLPAAQPSAPPPANSVPTHEQPPGESAEPESQDQETPADSSMMLEQLRRALELVLGDKAGVSDTDAVLRIVEELAAIVAIMTPHLMAAVSSRTQFKETLRLSQTLIRARENNPLKLPGEQSLALRRLLLNDEPGMLEGRLAVEEAFSELATHQAAMLAALKPALRVTMENVSPSRVERDAPTSAIDRLAVPVRRGKLWEAYCERYEKLMQSDARSIEQRFLDAYADQYEAALSRLKR